MTVPSIADYIAVDRRHPTPLVPAEFAAHLAELGITPKAWLSMTTRERLAYEAKHLAAKR